MISLDTSVLVRYLVGSPREQARRATAVMDREEQLGISIVAIVETAHVLRTQYGVDRPEIVAVLIDLVTRDNVTTLGLPTPEVLEALVRCRSLPGSPIPDALIAAAARSEGALPVYTFDLAFGRLGVPVVSP